MSADFPTISRVDCLPTVRSRYIDLEQQFRTKAISMISERAVLISRTEDFFAVVNEIGDCLTHHFPCPGDRRMLTDGVQGKIASILKRRQYLCTPCGHCCDEIHKESISKGCLGGCPVDKCSLKVLKVSESDIFTICSNLVKEMITPLLSLHAKEKYLFKVSVDPSTEKYVLDCKDLESEIIWTFPSNPNGFNKVLFDKKKGLLSLYCIVPAKDAELRYKEIINNLSNNCLKVFQSSHRSRSIDEADLPLGEEIVITMAEIYSILTLLGMIIKTANIAPRHDALGDGHSKSIFEPLFDCLKDLTSFYDKEDMERIINRVVLAPERAAIWWR